MIHAVVKNQSAIDGLARRQAATRNLGPLFGVIGNRLRNDTMRNFREGGWYPSKWPASKRVEGMTRGRTLVRTGALRNSISLRTDANSARIGSALPHARIHQLGGVIPAHTIRPRTGKALRIPVGGGNFIFRAKANIPAVRIPARPYLPVLRGRLHPSTVTFIGTEFSRHIGRA